LLGCSVTEKWTCSLRPSFLLIGTPCYGCTSELFEECIDTRLRGQFCGHLRSGAALAWFFNLGFASVIRPSFDIDEV
jgi:hypothetical protein